MSDNYLSRAVLSLADIPEAVETVLAEDPAWAESLSSNPFLKPSSWDRVLAHKPRVKVVANLCDRTLADDQIEDLVAVKEVRFGALSSLERANGIAADHASRLAARRMPTRSAVLLASAPGMAREDLDALAAHMSPRAGLAFFADNQDSRGASSTAAWQALVARFEAPGHSTGPARAAMARVLWSRAHLRAKVLRPNAPFGLLPVIASFPLSVEQRALVRDRAVTATGAEVSIAVATLTNLFVAGRLAGSGDTILDGEAAEALGSAAAVSSNIMLAGFSRPHASTSFADFERVGRLPIRSLPAALHVTHRAFATESHKEGEKLARRIDTPLYVDQMGLAIAKAAARAITLRTGYRASVNQLSKSSRREQYRHKPVEEVLENPAEQPTALVMSHLAADGVGDVAGSIADYVAQRLGSNLEAWRICLGILDENETIPADAVAAALQLTS